MPRANNHIQRLNQQMGRSRQKAADRSARHRAAKRKPKAKGTTKPQPIRVQLDARTVATIAPHMLDFWRGRYPKLTIITPAP